MVIPMPRLAIYEYRWGPAMRKVFQDPTVMKDGAFVVKITLCVRNLVYISTNTSIGRGAFRFIRYSIFLPKTSITTLREARGGSQK